MIEKRIRLQEDTFDALMDISDELKARPSSRQALADAIDRSAKLAKEHLETKIVVDEKTRKIMDEMVRFGLFETKNDIVTEALEKIIAENRTVLKEKIAEYYEALIE